MIKFNDMNRQDQQAYLMKPIIDELKQVGGQATTRDLKRAVVEREENIPENILTMYKTSRSVWEKTNFQIPKDDQSNS